VNGPWNQLDMLLIGFSDTNFPAIWQFTWMTALVILVLGIVLYNFQNHRLRSYAVFLDLNEWLLWTSVGVASLVLLFTLFSFDFIFVLPTMVGGAALYIWIRFIHFPPLIEAYEERLARQRYFQRSRTAHPEATIRSKAAPAKQVKRRRR
jgi:hypothetical protein